MSASPPSQTAAAPDPAGELAELRRLWAFAQERYGTLSSAPIIVLMNLCRRMMALIERLPVLDPDQERAAQEAGRAAARLARQQGVELADDAGNLWGASELGKLGLAPRYERALNEAFVAEFTKK
jgi:hypothetical protein